MINSNNFVFGYIIFNCGWSKHICGYFDALCATKNPL